MQTIRRKESSFKRRSNRDQEQVKSSLGVRKSAELADEVR